MKRVRIFMTAGVLIAAGSALVLTRAGAGEAKDVAGTPDSRSQVPVVTTPASTMEFMRSVVVAGDVAAVKYALVSARVPGTLDEVLVSEGDEVRAGETVLFRTDSVNLAKAVELARREEEVAVCAVRETRADLKRLTAIHEQAETDVARYRRLAKTGAATDHQLERMETQYREAAATLEHAHAVIDLALARQSQAASRLKIAEKDLSDSTVLAPIDGRVVERLREPGEMAGAGSPVLRVENHEVLELTAFIPEEYYGEVVPGTTPVRARVGKADLGSLPLTFRAPIVHSTLRNFEVKVTVAHPPADLVPGRRADLNLVLQSHRGLGVPRPAVLMRGGRTVVFTVVDGKAKMVPVELGLSTDGHVEVLGGSIADGAKIVVEGQSWLDDGTPVIGVKEE
jgi:RND family efflux transporter MFP subunit